MKVTQLAAPWMPCSISSCTINDFFYEHAAAVRIYCFVTLTLRVAKEQRAATDETNRFVQAEELMIVTMPKKTLLHAGGFWVQVEFTFDRKQFG